MARDIKANPHTLVEARVLADASLLSTSCLRAFLGLAPTDAHVHFLAAWFEGFFLCRSLRTYDKNNQSFLLGTPAGSKKGGESFRSSNARERARARAGARAGAR